MNRDKTIFMTHTLQLSISYVSKDKYQWYCMWIKDGKTYKLIQNHYFKTEKLAHKDFRRMLRTQKGKTYHYENKTYRISYKKSEL